MHSLLRRQLKRFFGESPPAEQRGFVDAVDAAYHQFDVDRSMLERSLDLSSQELLQANTQLRAVLQAFPDMLFRVDGDGVVLDAKVGATADVAPGPEGLVGRRLQDLQLGDLSGRFADAVADLREGRPVVSLEYSLAGKLGLDHFEARLVRSPADEIIVIVRNITERRKAEEDTRHGLSLLRSTLESTADGILVVEMGGHIVSFNRRFAEMWGMPDDVLASRDDQMAVSHAVRQLKNPEQFLAKIHEVYGQPEAESFDVLEFLDGRVVERFSMPQRLDGVPVGRVWSFRDVTAHKRAEERLVHEAIHDNLTGLPNRTLFMDRLTQSLQRAHRHPDTRFAVLFVDLDRFKVVNDSLGHLLGDELLVTTAARLCSCVRKGDTVARLGGDEFAVLLEDVGAEGDAVELAQRAQQAVGAPCTLRGFEVFSTASIGIATSAPHYREAEELLRDADTAMYAAKARGGARHEVFHLGMHSTAVARLELESDLRRALGRDELLLHYQPIVRLDSRDLVGFEALLRWRHPEKGFIYPGDFIPVAEETGMILPIGRWVLEQACRQMREWRLRFPSLSHLSVSVNLSSRQLTRPDLVHDIEHALEVSSLAPEHLVIELTESVLMESGQTSTAVLDRLRELGIRIHLDDFGTGYSSLSYLHRLPLDALKIDRSFVARLDEPGENLEIVRTVLRLAQNLGMGVVAEGIETGDQLDRLRALGCPCGQGYYFSRPLDPAAVLPLLWGAARAGTGPRAALDETTGGGPAEVLPFQSLPAPGRAPTSGEAAAGDLPRQRTSRR